MEALRQGVDLLQRESADGPSVLAIGALPTVAGALLPPALVSFRSRWPIVSVSLWTASNHGLLDGLKSGEAAFVVGRLSEPEEMAGLSFEHLFHEPLAAVVRAGHDISSENNVPASNLTKYPVIVPPFGTLIRQSADSVLSAFGAHSVAPLIETLSVSFGRAMTLQNDAVWFVPFSAAEDDIKRGLFDHLKMPFPGTDEPIGLIRSSGSPLSPAALDLAKAIRDVVEIRERMRVGSKYGG